MALRGRNLPLNHKTVRQSMSRRGNCLDNAVMENFFGLLKSEPLHLQQFRSMEHFRQELIEYLDYCNNRRSKSTERACRLLFTDAKPFPLTEFFCAELLSNFLRLLQKVRGRMIPCFEKRW